MPELVLCGIRLLAKQLLGTVLDLEVDQSGGRTRFTCYLCDFNLCQGCVARQEKLLTCLQNLCDKVRLHSQSNNLDLC